MKVRDVIARLKEAGWEQVRQESSHRQFRKDGSPFVVTVPGHDREDLSPGVLSDVRRKSGLRLR